MSKWGGRRPRWPWPGASLGSRARDAWGADTARRHRPAFAQIVNVHWSSDSRHLAYLVESLNRWSVCVDGQMAKNSFEGFLVGTDLIFVTPERLRALALKKGPEFIRYEIEI